MTNIEGFEFLNSVDLFCGGGGAGWGFHEAGFITTSAFDNAWHCVETYNKNFGKVAQIKNISKLRSEPILEKFDEKISLVTASPPCEPFTVANQNRLKNSFNRLFDDATGRLMLHSIRLIADLDPEYFVIENVMGILEGDGRKLLSEEFVRLGLGRPTFNILNAVDWGVPSQRKRVIISNLKLNAPNSRVKTVMDSIGDLPDPSYPNEYEYHRQEMVSSDYRKRMITLPSGEGLVHYRASRSDFKNYVRLYPNRPSPVVMGKSRYIHPYDDRLLTPFEHGRLMTFPDEFHFIGTREQIYDIIGEAIPPRITFEIGKQIRGRL